MEFLLQGVNIGFGQVQLHLSGIDFCLRGSARLCQPLHGLQVALSDVAVGLRFHQRVPCGEQFFLRSASGYGCKLSLRALDLGLGARDLRAGLGVVQLHQQLAGFNPVPLMDVDAPDCCRERRVGFKVVDGLNFAVGGDAGSDGFAIGAGSPNLDGRAAKRQCRRENQRRENHTNNYDPAGSQI